MNDSHACEAEMKLYSTRKTSTTQNCTARRLCAYDTVCFTVNNCHSSFWFKCSGIIVCLDGYEHFPLVYLLAAPVKRIWMISWISHMYANCACMWFASVDVMKIVPGLLGLSVNMVALCCFVLNELDANVDWCVTRVKLASNGWFLSCVLIYPARMDRNLCRACFFTLPRSMKCRSAQTFVLIIRFFDCLNAVGLDPRRFI